MPAPGNCSGGRGVGGAGGHLGGVPAAVPVLPGGAVCSPVREQVPKSLGRASSLRHPSAPGRKVPGAGELRGVSEGKGGHM